MQGLRNKNIKRRTYTIVAEGSFQLWDKCKEGAKAVVQCSTEDMDCPLGYLLDEDKHTVKIATLDYPRRSRKPNVQVLRIPKAKLTDYRVRS